MSSLSKLQQAMRAKLEGARFRFLNEQLYSQPGADSFAMMKAEPSLFHAYHAGYRSQVEGWPENPLDRIIAEVRKAPRTAVIADFGCGEARLASSVPQTVHSFDLVAANARVTACDIANVPLGDGCVDVAVFCLSLMGTNYTDFLAEASRVLKPGGRLLIAEVRSRFEGADEADEHAAADAEQAPVGSKRKFSAVAAADSRHGHSSDKGRESGLPAFIAAVKTLGFSLERLNEGNAMFVTLWFRKAADGKEPAAGGAPAGSSTAGSRSAGAPSSSAAKRADLAPAASSAASAGAGAAIGGAGRSPPGIWGGGKGKSEDALASATGLELSSGAAAGLMSKSQKRRAKKQKLREAAAMEAVSSAALKLGDGAGRHSDGPRPGITLPPAAGHNPSKASVPSSERSSKSSGAASVSRGEPPRKKVRPIAGDRVPEPEAVLLSSGSAGTAPPPAKRVVSGPALKPCIYKRR